MVMVSSAVPPTLIVLTEKVFETVGLEGETVSISDAEQTPATVQEAETFVLETLTGGVMDATLLTCVCASTADEKKRTRKDSIASTKDLEARPTVRNCDIDRQQALKKSKKFSRQLLLDTLDARVFEFTQHNQSRNKSFHQQEPKNSINAKKITLALQKVTFIRRFSKNSTQILDQKPFLDVVVTLIHTKFTNLDSIAPPLIETN